MRLQTFLSALAFSAAMLAQTSAGGLTPEILKELKQANVPTSADKALRNALAANSINSLAVTANNQANSDTHFSHTVKSIGITNQEHSGRCWLFTGLNVMRAKAIVKHDLGSFQFSQSYCFFYDQLEKANLFLQAMIDNASKPMDDKTVEWLFKNPLSDGGQFTGIQDIITKYGVVPAEIMTESFNANNTSKMSSIISSKLREYGLQLRDASAKGNKRAAIERQKVEMLKTIYHILAICLGEPPVEFTWTRTNGKGEPVSTKTYTPLAFYNEFVGADLKNNYVMLMNDPTREYYKLYTIDLDRHAYDGENWTYINLPIEDIKKAAIASIKDSVMMYFSCDVGKCYNSKTGILSLDNFDYESLFATTFSMNKADRIRTFESASSHAMTLMAVDLDTNGKPTKWMVENSWGATSGYKGHLIMTDEWFNEYMFRLVVEKRFVSDDILKLLSQKPVKLPAWDPLFAPEE